MTAADDRSDSRERALNLLYEAQSKGVPVAEVIDALVVRPDDLAERLARGSDDCAGRADELIAAKARGWTLARRPVIDLAVMRMATFEVLERPEVPTAVVLDEGQAGDNIGALLRGTKKEDVERGQVLCAPGSITPHTNFEGQVYVLTKEEGGRHKPFFNNYRPQFFFRTTDVTGTVELPKGTEMVMPGDNVVMTVELGKAIAMDEGLRFAIREGGRTVGAGRVTKIIK